MDFYDKENYALNEKPVLILHIGSPKTGSSALQMCLAKNRQFLFENKICYADINEEYKNHTHWIVKLILEYCEKMTPTLEDEAYSETNDKIASNLKSIFYKDNCEILLISSEILFNPTITFADFYINSTETMITRRRNYVMKYIKEVFKEFEIRVICYLRRQDEYIESIYNELCKNIRAENDGYGKIFNNPLCVKLGRNKYTIDEEDNAAKKPINKLLNSLLDVGHYTNLSQWAEIYGKENIIVRPYEKSQLPSGIEYDFFTNVLGFDATSLADLELFKEINASWKKDILEYKMAGRLFDLQNEFHALNESPALAHLSENNKKNILSASQAEDILEYYKEDNAKIAREYLDREDGVLFYDKMREEKDDYPGLSAQAAIDISRELVLMLKTKVKEYDTLLDKTYRELFAAQGQLGGVQAQLENKQNEINTIMQSTSWKLTKPVRFLKRLISKK